MNIRLRLITPTDYPLTMAWRSNPLVYQGFYQQDKPLTWDEHTNWNSSRNKDWRTFIIMYEDRPVGVVIISQLDHWEPELGWYIGEITLWGQGIGKESVKLGLEYLRSNGYKYCHATIKEDNIRSLHLARSLGFKIIGSARKGEKWLRLAL